jgi:hypothetical protein
VLFALLPTRSIEWSLEDEGKLMCGGACVSGAIRNNVDRHFVKLSLTIAHKSKVGHRKVL